MSSLWMLSAGLAFALLAVCVKLGAMHGISAGLLVFSRSFVSFLILYVWMRFRGMQIETRQWKLHIASAAVGLVSLASYFYALQQLSLATAVTLNNASPIFLGLLLMVRRQQPVRAASLLALALGFVGVAFLLQPSFDATEWLGYAMALFSAITAAFYISNIRRLAEAGESTARTVLYFSLFSSIGVLPWATATVDERVFSWVAIGLLLGVGVFAVIGQMLMTHAFQKGNPLVTASLAYSQVAFSIALGIVLWQDAIPAHVGIGIFLIIASGVLTSALGRRTA